MSLVLRLSRICRVMLDMSLTLSAVGGAMMATVSVSAFVAAAFWIAARRSCSAT